MIINSYCCAALLVGIRRLPYSQTPAVEDMVCVGC